MVEPRRMQSLIFNPIWRKGGHYGPDDYEKLWGFYRIRARPPKIIDFDPFYVWMVPFLNFKFWPFFGWNFSIFATIFQQPVMPKLKFIEN